MEDAAGKRRAVARHRRRSNSPIAAKAAKQEALSQATSIFDPKRGRAPDKATEPRAQIAESQATFAFDHKWGTVNITGPNAPGDESEAMSAFMQQLGHASDKITEPSAQGARVRGDDRFRAATGARAQEDHGAERPGLPSPRRRPPSSRSEGR